MLQHTHAHTRFHLPTVLMSVFKPHNQRSERGIKATGGSGLMESSGALRPTRSRCLSPDKNHRNLTQETVSHNSIAMLTPKQQKVTKCPPPPPPQPCNQASCPNPTQRRTSPTRTERCSVLPVNCNDLIIMFINPVLLKDQTQRKTITVRRMN